MIFDHLKALLEARGHALSEVTSESLGDAPRSLPGLSNINRSYRGFRRPNYYLDEASRQKYLVQPHSQLGYPQSPVIAEQKIEGFRSVAFDLPEGWQESHELPELAWRLRIEKDAVTTALFSDFRKLALKIQERYGSLAHPEAINEIVYAIGLKAWLEYGFVGGRYKSVACRRWETGEPVFLSELIALGEGECTDTALLAFIFGKIVQELDSGYQVRVVKVGMTGPRRVRGHYLAVLTAPNNRLYLIDPLFNSFGLYEDYLHPEYEQFEATFLNFMRVVQMSQPRAQCSAIVSQPMSQRFGL